jgi:oligopeptide transport system substrate-binding protein
MPGHAAGIALRHDPRRARELLAAAGYGAGRRLPEITVRGFPGSQAFLEVLTAQWRACLGAAVQFSVITDFADDQQSLQEDPPNIHLQGWVPDYPDPDSMFTGSPGVRGHCAQLDQLLEQVRTVRDQQARMRLFQQAEDVLVTDARIVPVLYNQESLLVKPWVRGMNLSPSAYWCLEDVIIEPHD